MSLLKCSAMILVLVSFTMPSARLFAQQPTLAQLFAEDQKDREHAMGMPNAEWQKVRARDAERRLQVRTILAAGPLPTAADYKHAAYILQHGTRANDYLLAHVLATTAVSKGDLTARYIAAATLDRYLQAIHQPQVYGTQYEWKRPGPTPKDATQAPYDKGLLPDSLRTEACVVTLGQQTENIKAMDAGKDTPHEDGCH